MVGFTSPLVVVKHFANCLTALKFQVVNFQLFGIDSTITTNYAEFVCKSFSSPPHVLSRCCATVVSCYNSHLLSAFLYILWSVLDMFLEEIQFMYI